MRKRLFDELPPIEQKGRNPFSTVEVGQVETEPTQGSNPFSGVNLQQPASDVPPQPETQVGLTQPIEQPQPLFQPLAPPTQLEQKTQAYNDALAAPVKKQGIGKQILFQALQAIGNIATGENEPIEFLGNAKKKYAVNQAFQELAPLQQQEEWKVGQEAKRVGIENARLKPILEREKIENRAITAEQNNLTRQYNSLSSYDENDPDDRAFGDAFQAKFGYRPLAKNAKTKSEQVVDQSTGQVYLMQTDEQGKQKVIKLAREDGTPFVIQSKEMLGASEKAKQRELSKYLGDTRNATNIQVAKITNDGRIQVANISQAGQNQRQELEIKAKEQLTILEGAQKAERDAKTAEEKRAAQERQIAAQNEYIRLRAEAKKEQ